MSTTQSLRMHRQPTLVLAPEAWQTMLTYVQLCPDEISGWAYVQSLNNRTFYVAPDDVFITDQEVSIGSADVDASTMAHAIGQAAEVGKIEQLRLQWHSHVNGATNFSTIDTSTMDAYEGAGAVWIVSLVLNKRGEARARLDLYSPIRVSTDVPIVVAQAIDPQLVENCKQQIVKHVKRRPKPTPIVDGQNKPRRKPTARLIKSDELTTQDVRVIALPINPS